METKNNIFTQRLSELISISKKSQNKICNELGIYKQKFSRWKNGNTEPSFDELILLSKYFGVSTDFLLGVEDEADVKTDN